jgi:AcrR family transcriptional regulator
MDSVTSRSNTASGQLSSPAPSADDLASGDAGNGGSTGGGSGDRGAGSAGKGARTREAILAKAADIASLDGLEQLTLGRLAAALPMSKSGLYAHFGSKTDLQLATVAAARAVFEAEVVAPAAGTAPGLPRLRALCASYLSYAERRAFPGGCFFVAVAAEFDSRPGPVRDAIAAAVADWQRLLTLHAGRAVENGDLAAGTDTARLAYELLALVMTAAWQQQLLPDGAAFAMARAAIAARIGD